MAPAGFGPATRASTDERYGQDAAGTERTQCAFTEQRSQLSFPGGTSGPDDTTGYGVFYTDRGGGPLDTGLCDLGARYEF